MAAAPGQRATIQKDSGATGMDGLFNARKPNAIPGGGAMPIDRAKNRKANAIPGGGGC